MGSKLTSTGLVTSGSTTLTDTAQQWDGGYAAFYGTSYSSTSFTGSPSNQTIDFYIMPTVDLTTVSLSFQDNGAATENIRFHNKIYTTSTNTYNYVNNGTSVNLTVNRSMGYTSSFTTANAEYGMYVRVHATSLSWYTGFKNFPRFHVEYFYIANDGSTYHGFVSGGVNALGTTSLNRQLWTPVITTNNNVYMYVTTPIL